MKFLSIVMLIFFTFLTPNRLLAGNVKKAKSESEIFLEKVSGVYKKTFNNGLADGSKYESENILEIVPVDDKAAYVRLELKFFNGHEGGIYGVATYGKESLVLETSPAPESRCLVELVWSENKILTKASYEKTPGCSSYHGARGSLDGAEFLTSKKRKIKYMKQLKSSMQYQEAVASYKKAAKPN